MMDLVACPVCTLYLHKGMSLEEHLETHPKEQVIKALVFLATGSLLPSDAASTVSTSKTSIHAESIIPSPASEALTSNSDLSSNSKSQTSLVVINPIALATTSKTSSSGNSSCTAEPLLSSNFNDSLSNREQQSTSSLNLKSNSALNSGSNRFSSNEHYAFYSSNNKGNQNNGMDLPSHLQHLFNPKTKQLPPPPAYGQAISQLRSQNTINYARTNTTKSLANLSLNNTLNNFNIPNNKKTANNIENNANVITNNHQMSKNSSTATSFSIINHQSTSSYDSCQETLDFSLPKHHNHINLNNSQNIPGLQYHNSQQLKRALSSETMKSQYSDYLTNSEHTSYQSNISKLVNSNHLSNNVNILREPSPICLITSTRFNENSDKESHQTNKGQSNSSSVLRFADTPSAAQYIERDSGDFLVQESPRHIVECIEKDNGEFSVIEKIIRSPPSIISVNEQILDESISTTNNDIDAHNFIEAEMSGEDKQSYYNKSDNFEKKDSFDEREILENNIKIESSEDSANSYNDEMMITDYFNHKIKEENKESKLSSKRKLNMKGVKVLSNVKLDANKSLEIVENIQKCSTEEFWTGIVNTIKKEEIEKFSTTNILPSTSAKFNEDISEKKIINEKTSQNSNDLSTEENATKTFTTSVICLAIKQKQSKSLIMSNKVSKMNKDLTTQNENESCVESILNSNDEPVATSFAGMRTQCTNKTVNYKKNPKKLVVKFKNPLPRPLLSPHCLTKDENQDQSLNGITRENSEIDSFKAESSSIHKVMEDTDENTLNNMMEQIVNEEDTSYDVTASMNSRNKSASNINEENSKLKVETESEFVNINNQLNSKNSSTSSSLSSTLSSSSSSSSSSCSSASTSASSLSSLTTEKANYKQSSFESLRSSDLCTGKKIFVESKSNNPVQSETKKQNETISETEGTKTVFIIEELNDEQQLDVKLSTFEQDNLCKNTYNEFADINCTFSTNEALVETTIPESSPYKANKTEKSKQQQQNELLNDIHPNQNSSQQNVYCDYPFSFLYSTSSTALPNSTSINFANNNFQQANNQNNSINGPEIIFNSNSSSSNVLDKTNNSVSSHAASTSSSVSVYSKGSINNDNAINSGIQIFSRYVGPTIFTSREDGEIEEKNSYLDLDLCTRNIANNNLENHNANNIGNGIMSINSATAICTQNSRDNLVSELNIRTDEKMPAKGEISEQESNGDIENSWSQPIYNELSYKYSNPYDVSHESWSLSHDDFFNPHDLNNVRSKVPINTETDIDVKPNIPGTSSECLSTSKKVKKRKKPPALFSNNTTVMDTVNINSTTVASSSVANPQINSNVVSKKKAYQCVHCSIVFVRLKDRNHHLVNIHQYKRVNRRLIREAPSSTVTSASLNNSENHLTNNENSVIIGDTKPNLNETINSMVVQSQYIKTESEFPANTQTINQNGILTSRTDEITNMDDKKPNLALVAAPMAPQIPRTKYDSIRTNVYRLLMNFNLGVLKQNSDVEIDQNLFNSKSFCCMVCKRDFISVKLFDEHLTEHPAECFTCNKKFSRWTYFSIHLKRHLGWKDFGCTICQKKFVIRSALVEHMRIHTGLTPLSCNLCSKSFKRYSNLTQHKRFCQTKRTVRKKDYVCYCGEVLTTKARFIWHKETHDPKPKCCPWCCDRFIHANSLRRHIRLAHADKFAYSAPAECPICNNIYAKTSLKSHMATHSMDTQHECAICNKSFSTKWNLKIHSWVHANRTAKPFKCEYCTKAFVREIDYKNHINAHKQIRPYTCEYCGCKFIRKYNYLRHRREHHGQKKFSCDLCGKLFHRHYYLIEHRRIHTGERPFLCTICGKTSTTKTNHNKHLKIHHSRDPFTSEA